MQTQVALPPGPQGLPVVGNLIQFRRDPLTFVTAVHRTYGGVASVRILNRTVVMFFRPEHAQFFMVDHARSFAAGMGRDVMKRFLGEGLLTTDDPVHRWQRRLVQPAFHKKRVEGYADVMTSQTRQMLDEWRVGDELDIAQALQELTLRIVVKALFNLDLQEQGTSISRLFSQVVENQSPGLVELLPQQLMNLPGMPGRKAMDGRHALDEFVYALIARRRTDGQDEGDVLSMLLAARDEDGKAMSDLELRDQTMTLIAAGHETTSNALAWTFYLLARNPERYDLLRGELARVLQGRPPTADDLSRLPYLDWVINESMRVYPPAWSLNRTALEEFELAGYRFPAGTHVVFSQWVMHHLPDVWGDPEVFRPERWDPAHDQQVPRGAYFPFGAGPRMCIGMPLAEMEARLLLATILQRFTPQMVPGWNVVPVPRVTLRMKHGLRVRLDAPDAPLAATVSAETPARRAHSE